MTDFLDDETLLEQKHAKQKAASAKYSAKYNASEKGRANNRTRLKEYHARSEVKERNRIRLQEYRKAGYFKDRYAPELLKAWQQKYLAKPENKEKRDTAAKAWREANPDKISEHHRLWVERNREKTVISASNRRALVKFRGGKLSPNIAALLMERQGGKCNACKIKLTLKNRHLDHIQPLNKGGAHTDSNMQLLCASCNCSKRDRDPIEFMQSRGFLL